VTVLLGTGDGSFRAAGTFSVGPNLNAVAVGDLDADGRLDVATARATAAGSPR
jgi:hypothetical protein